MIELELNQEQWLIKMPTKRLKCEYEGCDKSYCSSFNLKRHIEIIHLGLRRFKCPQCERMLSSKQNLLDHKNIHTGAKPYICELPGCGQPFRQLSQYYIHRQLHHEVVTDPSTINFISSSILSFLSEKITVDSNTTTFKLQSSQSLVDDLPKIAYNGEIRSLPLLEILKTKAD